MVIILLISEEESEEVRIVKGPRKSSYIKEYQGMMFLICFWP